MDFTAHYDSPLGGITLASDGEALVGLWFDGQKYYFAGLSSDYEERIGLEVFDIARRWLDVYFSGGVPDFVPALRMRGTAFQKRAWEALLTIPYGQVITYGEMVRRIDCTSARAVGGAVGRNPISLIIPCHRVVGADGSPTGYAGGTDRKKWLLAMEGALKTIVMGIENKSLLFDSKQEPDHDCCIGRDKIYI